MDLEGLDVAAIIGDQYDDTINIFGHAAMAVTNQGVYSWGTNHEWGHSLYAYLWGGSTSNGFYIDGEVEHRNVVIYIIRSDVSHDYKAINEFFKVYNKGYSISNGRTCATAVSGALHYGLGLKGVNMTIFPWTLKITADKYDSVKITFPQGSSFPYDIYMNYLAQFEKNY